MDGVAGRGPPPCPLHPDRIVIDDHPAQRPVGPPLCQIRPRRENDLTAVVEVIRDAVLGIAVHDYHPAQLQGWLLFLDDLADLRQRLQQGWTVVAEDPIGVVALGQLHPDDHIQALYCRPRGRGRGHARALLVALEQEGRRRGARAFSTESSRTARPFFEKHGYHVVEEEFVERGGVLIPRWKMRKPALSAIT